MSTIRTPAPSHLIAPNSRHDPRNAAESCRPHPDGYKIELIQR